jgi:quinol monooxygenase YgiN
VVELRQYTLHPGQRDTLIELFDREFVESQEASGIRIIGQFRDLDNPDRFVWLRGFPDMDARDRALHGFYGGPVWATHRATANATMLDASNVLLLRPARARGGFCIEGRARAPIGATQCPNGLIVATICYFRPSPDPDFIDFFDNGVRPALAAAGAAVIGCFVTEASENTFPILPVRNENVFAWFSTFRNSADYATHLARRDRSRRWLDKILPDLCRQLVRDPEVLRLSPTGRSLLVHSVE